MRHCVPCCVRARRFGLPRGCRRTPPCSDPLRGLSALASVDDNELTFVDLAINIGQVDRQLGSLPGHRSITLRLYRIVDVEDETYYHIVEQRGIDCCNAVNFCFQTLPRIRIRQVKYSRQTTCLLFVFP